jgi:hypothetical protein
LEQEHHLYLFVHHHAVGYVSALDFPVPVLSAHGDDAHSGVYAEKEDWA